MLIQKMSITLYILLLGDYVVFAQGKIGKPLTTKTNQSSLIEKNEKVGNIFYSKTYQQTPAKIHNLIHTKLDVHFDFQKSYLYGKEWVTLQPHVYSTDSLTLDAKGMNIHSLELVKDGKHIPLVFTYDSLILSIKLDKRYDPTENFTIYIDYTAKPTELAVKNDSRGLYFINPDGSKKDKPTQIWTQGEPECSSAWFPTIDKPNQKTTGEISMTVPAKFTTLSNGFLAAQENNADQTRTDIWKMELPHAPYLFMMAVGEFKIYKDSWRGKEISYYLDSTYAPYAKDIFGITPEAIDFFSTTLGVDFPWSKYAQVAVHDFVSGAMENTTATIFGDNILATKRELADKPHNTGIVHELFHQWFGDYVTTESWSNLTLNESFADFGEIIWLEYKYGKDAADEHIYQGMHGYLDNADAAKKNLVRFDYQEKQEVFDAVTYQKGGRILTMLRNYLGNEVFYKGLNIYLKTNAFKSAEAHHLRLALEEASGMDLNWFFNQWYFGAGHPKLHIDYKWDELAKTQFVYLQQKQDGSPFILPMAIDMYVNGKKQRHTIWMQDKADTLTFKLPSKPDLVNVDGDKILLAQKQDNKSLEEYVFQYLYAPLYLDRYEAIEAAIANQQKKGGQTILLSALSDKYDGLRLKAINAINVLENGDLTKKSLPILKAIMQKDENYLVRAAAITKLGEMKIVSHLDLFKKALQHESYAVQGAALQAIALQDASKALTLAKSYEPGSKGKLKEAIDHVYVTYGNNEQWPYVYSLYGFPHSPGNYPFTAITNFLSRLENASYVVEGIEAIKSYIVSEKKVHMKDIVIKELNQIKKKRLQLHDQESVKVVDEAIRQIGQLK
jgi:aminopeptidase N